MLRDSVWIVRNEAGFRTDYYSTKFTCREDLLRRVDWKLCIEVFLSSLYFGLSSWTKQANSKYHHRLLVFGVLWALTWFLAKFFPFIRSWPINAPKCEHHQTNDNQPTNSWMRSLFEKRTAHSSVFSQTVYLIRDRSSVH